MEFSQLRLKKEMIEYPNRKRKSFLESTNKKKNELLLLIVVLPILK